ncbi:speedy protein E3-like [Trichomycterus rosablanca]|uniref:speedy protein E3-like n=1 Tax=Trichomycterus rosablanca TaxID=2290929 RepID=UPI002F35F2E0
MPENQNAKLEWSEELPVGAGLENNHNTCYLNSVLQCLTYTAPLASYMLSGEHSRTCHQNGLCMMCTMEAHITQVLNSSGKVIEPFGVLCHLHRLGPQFALGFSQDPHEFLLGTLKAMHESSTSGSGCRKIQPGINYVSFGQNSKVLVFKLNPGNCNKHVDYPEKLDMKPFMCQRSRKPEKYELYGIVARSAHDSGQQHCYSYVKACNGQWYELNDTLVTVKDKSSALNQLIYMLFYISTSSKFDIKQQKNRKRKMQHEGDEIPAKKMKLEQPDSKPTSSAHFSVLEGKKRKRLDEGDESPAPPQPSVQESQRQRRLDEGDENPAKRMKLERTKSDPTSPPQLSVQESKEQRQLDEGNENPSEGIKLERTERNQTSTPQLSVLDCKKHKRLDEGDENPAKRMKLENPQRNQTSPPQLSVQEGKKHKRLDEGDENPAKRMKLENPQRNQTSPPQLSVQEGKKRKRLDEGDENPAKRMKLENPQRNQTSPPQLSVQEGKKRKRLDEGDENPAKRMKLERTERNQTSPPQLSVQEGKKRKQLDEDDENPVKRMKLERTERNQTSPPQLSVQESKR